MAEGGQKRSWQSGLRDAGPYAGLGLQIAGTLLFFTGGGILVDRWLGSSPWGVLGGTALAFLGLTALLYRLVKETSGRSKRPVKGAGESTRKDA